MKRNFNNSDMPNTRNENIESIVLDGQKITKIQKKNWHLDRI